MKRKIINIDESVCNGCGQCVPNCPEGALQIIDGKARLVSDLFCDGLGACIGNCPLGAIEVTEREAEQYDECKVMENIVKGGQNVIRAHLEHLEHHGAREYFEQAKKYLAEHAIPVPCSETQQPHRAGCPGSRSMSFESREKNSTPAETTTSGSELTHWPVQMHLLNPHAPHFKGADFLLAADCTAFSLGAFHQKLLKGRTLGIGCPKLDLDKESYVEKIVTLIDEAAINTLTVAIMEVPCCGGLLALAKEAVTRASHIVPLKLIVIGIQGDVIKEEWV